MKKPAKQFTDAMKQKAEGGEIEPIDWPNVKPSGTINLTIEGSSNLIERLALPVGFDSIDCIRNYQKSTDSI